MTSFNDAVGDLREQLLLEYKEAMQSQRANTSLVYSWTGNILMILTTALFVFGATANAAESFYPAMVFAILLVIIWFGMTKTFVFYTRQRLMRINQIEDQLGMRLMSAGRDEIKDMGWRSRFVEARTYVRIFAFLYILIWIWMSWLKFKWL